MDEKIERIRKRGYYFVFQNSNYEKKHEDGYMWTPQKSEKGKKVTHWDQMKNVKEDDLIIHCSNKKILALSIAKKDVYEAEHPIELGNHWSNKGWKVEVESFKINNPIVTSDHIDKLKELQPKRHAPFNKSGKGNNGYLFKANYEMTKYIIKESIRIQSIDDEKNTLRNLLFYKDKFDIEKKLDQELINQAADSEIYSFDEDMSEYIPKAKKRVEAQIVYGKKSYPRDKKTALNALKRAHHECEVNKTHPSFLRKNSNTKYSEPHHLIPMSYQDLFVNSIDVEANIVSLCSNCHNQIHYGADSNYLIKEIYDQRIDELKKAGIGITLENLYELY